MTMRTIRVVKTPSICSAPPEIGEHWIGLELLAFSENEVPPMMLFGEKPNGFVVSIDAALQILRGKNSAAAQWFYANPLIQQADFFFFQSQDCELIGQ